MALLFSTSSQSMPASSAAHTAPISFASKEVSGQNTSSVASRQQSVYANTEEMARLGIDAVFCLNQSRVTHEALHQIERRDRAVLILQDGRRTLRDVARLLHRSDTDVAQVIVRLLKQGYVEYIGMRR